MHARSPILADSSSSERRPSPEIRLNPTDISIESAIQNPKSIWLHGIPLRVVVRVGALGKCLQLF